MTEFLARAIAEELNGKAHHTGGGIWIVRFDRADGSIVWIGDMGVSHYADQLACDEGRETTSIDFQSS